MDITLRQAWVALRLLVVMTVLLGVIYPVGVWAAGRVVPGRADGSFVYDTSGRIVGSSLIAQPFSGPTWFHPRPSAAGEGYDSLSSGGTNLANDNPKLVQSVAEQQKAIAAEDGVAAETVPADAVTSSGSGLDPDISPAYAQVQAARVARSRSLDPAKVLTLVDAHTSERGLGIFGEPKVNVLELNLALEQMQ